MAGCHVGALSRRARYGVLQSRVLAGGIYSPGPIDTDRRLFQVHEGRLHRVVTKSVLMDQRVFLHVIIRVLLLHDARLVLVDLRRIVDVSLGNGHVQNDGLFTVDFAQELLGRNLSLLNAVE